MRKIFQRIEHNNYLPSNTAGHGFEGWFQDTLPKPSVSGPSLAVWEAIARSFNLDPDKVMSYLETDVNRLDPDRDQQQGIYGIPFHTYKNGSRFSSRHYVQDTVGAGFPITLALNSLATRVLWANATKGCRPKAVGVEFLQGKSVYKADQRYRPENTGVLKQAFGREVILSGGAFNSPQLLKLSGVGPAAELTQFNISVVVDAPGVGSNLMDNEEMPIVGHINSTAARGNPSGCAMLRTGHAPSADTDVFVMHSMAALRGFWPPNQTNERLAADAPGTYGISLVKQFPQNGQGSVRLRSADPRDTPDITFRHYGEGAATDLGAMKDAVAWARRVHTLVVAPYGPMVSL